MRHNAAALEKCRTRVPSTKNFACSKRHKSWVESLLNLARNQWAACRRQQPQWSRNRSTLAGAPTSRNAFVLQALLLSLTKRHVLLALVGSTAEEVLVRDLHALAAPASQRYLLFLALLVDALQADLPRRQDSVRFPRIVASQAALHGKRQGSASPFTSAVPLAEPCRPPPQTRPHDTLFKHCLQRSRQKSLPR